MSRLGGIAAAFALIALALAAPASAATTGSAPTTTGQTLTVTVDSPSDGATFADDVATFSGHVSLSPPSDGSAGTSVTRVDWGIDHVYGIATGNAPAADGSWSYTLNSNGPRDIIFTARAADGTTAQADVHVTFRPYATGIWARPLMQTTVPPSMGALVFDEYDVRGPHDSGNTIDFYVLGQKVCSAVTVNGAVWCSDNVANLLATGAGGYDAVFAGNAYYSASRDHAGLNTD
jgi:hypothetical protein